MNKRFNHLRLNGIIAQSGMKQKDVADVLGVHYNTVSNWVNGKNQPHPEQLIDLLVGLGCDVDSIPLVDFWSVHTEEADNEQ